ncbi:hypothetical protein [Streptomyces sp. GSL17-111]|uniref:hypothetical protein n=1 Tax=Streptomyces sp. GSL17-111 TaxID=3121596 RepID=UPI0030F3B96F
MARHGYGRRTRLLLRLSGAVTAGGLLAALAGCSDGPDAAAPADEQRPSASSSPSSSPSPSASPEEAIETLADLRAFCYEHERGGQGWDAAAEYTGPGPHPIVVHVLEDRSDVEFDADVEDGYGTYEKWLPDSPEEARLVACARGRETEERIGTCEYSDRIAALQGEAYPLHAQPFEVTVHELRTGREVTSFDVESGETCPGSIKTEGILGDEPSLVYASFPGAAVDDLLVDLVNGPAR